MCSSDLTGSSSRRHEPSIAWAVTAHAPPGIAMRGQKAHWGIRPLSRRGVSGVREECHSVRPMIRLPATPRGETACGCDHQHDQKKDEEQRGDTSMPKPPKRSSSRRMIIISASILEFLPAGLPTANALDWKPPALLHRERCPHALLVMSLLLCFVVDVAD